MAKRTRKPAPESADRSTLIFASLALVVLFGIALIPDVRHRANAGLTILREDAMLVLDPSAERAYAYAEAHFDSAAPATYDLNRARTLYEQVLVLDPEYPHARHQLARIAFLESDLTRALVLINEEIEGETVSPSSYYIRGLIKGFAGDYDGAAKDYETYLKGDGTNWAAINDYAWVLIKGGRPLEALVAIDWGLLFWPDNAWLLNNKATAHYELQQLELAYEAVSSAEVTAANVTEEDWLQAYPGNDPLIASEGVFALKQAVASNMHTISVARESAAEDVR